MKKTLQIENKYFQYFTLVAALLALPFLKGISQVSLTTLGTAYTQNFDGLANSGTSSTVPTGWAFSEAGTNANTTYAAGTGTGNSGETFSFGATSATDRAFGSLASGSLQSKIGASFVNNTGSIITSLNIAYVCEEWRLGVASRTDQMNFEYSLNATTLNSGTWIPVTALNCVTPNTSTVVGAVNGNLTGNKSSISSTINSLAIAVGGTVWVRWSDVDITGADDGLAVDDFSLTPSASGPIPPTQLVITSITPTSPIAGTGFSVTVQAQDATNTPQNVIANTAFVLSTNGNAGSIGGTITGTINAGSSSVVVSGVTLSTGGTNVNITATRTSGDLLSTATSSTFTVVGLATQLAFVGVPSSGYVSSDIAAFTVEARRADNSVDVNYNGTITVAKASGPGTLSGTTSVAAVSGVATFSVLQFNQVGTYSLSTSSGALTTATSSPIVISPSPVTWNFTSPTAANVPANLTASTMTIGNTYGSSPPTMISSTSPSNVYTNASGGNNAGVPTATGTAVNTATNAYFEFSLTPDPNYVVTLNGLSFGTRSTGTGPQAFYIRSNKDNYTADIATGTIANSSAWALKTPAVSSTSSNAGNAITFRIYGYNGTGNATINQINWRIDDVLLNLTVSACTQPNISVNSGSICAGNSFTINPTGGVTYSVTGNNFTVSPTANTDYTVTGADAIGCTNTSISAVVVNTVPIVSVNSGSICAGSSFTISPSGASTYTISGGSSIVSPSANTDYTVTGTSAQGCLSSNQAVSSVTVNAIPTVSITGTSTVCSGYATSLIANGANTYVWSNGPTTAINNVTPTGNTTYSVIGTDGNGCTNTASVNVTTFLCVPNTSLQAVYCGTTLTSLSDRLKCILVSGATKYEWQVTDISTSTVYTIQSANNLVDMYLSYIPQVTYNKSYSIKVRAYSGSGIWGTFAGACTVNTPLSASTKLQSLYCGTTLVSLNDKLKCDLVPNTTKYEWEVTDVATSTVYTIQSTGSTNNVDMYLSYIPQVTYNKSYSIRVKAYSGGIWGTFGTACTINTPASSSTKLQTIYCGTTLTTLSDKLKCDLVAGSTKYEWEVTDIATGTPYLKQSSGSTNNIEMYLSYIPQVTFNKSYSIRVRAYSAGVWGTFGQSCTVTTPASGARFAFTTTEETEIGSSINVNAYPNPTSEILNVDFDNVPTNASLEIYNMVGELVLTQQLSELNNTINTTQLANGLYHTKVISNNKLLYAQKIVKQ